MDLLHTISVVLESAGTSLQESIAKFSENFSNC